MHLQILAVTGVEKGVVVGVEVVVIGLPTLIILLRLPPPLLLTLLPPLLRFVTTTTLLHVQTLLLQHLLLSEGRSTKEPGDSIETVEGGEESAVVEAKEFDPERTELGGMRCSNRRRRDGAR